MGRSALFDGRQASNIFTVDQNRNVSEQAGGHQVGVCTQKTNLRFVLLIEIEVFAVAGRYFCREIIQFDQGIVGRDDQTVVTDPRLVQSPVRLHGYIVLKVFDGHELRIIIGAGSSLQVIIIAHATDG
ncbi:hypothetical protein ABE541_15825 [Sphingobacterium kitahiroshimense]|uniref:Uncharacterized protein n=1 Tax=Sphingobacterium kitahiroshimense TaxID=470446 RepID=A0ABV0BW76_9SPHI